MKKLLSAATILLSAFAMQAQVTGVQQRVREIQLNTITTAVPFLLITPDSRAGGMGDAGVAISPDANSVHWNMGKLAFVEKDFEISLSYSPWLRNLVDDMSLSYLSGYKKLNKTQAIGGSLRYFSLGEIQFTAEDGTNQGQFKPVELALDFGFSQKLSERFGGGITARFVNSNLTQGQNVGGANTSPGRSLAVDLGLFYTNDDLEIGDKDLTWNWGLNLSNIGAKMSYTETADRDFIPANMRLGTALQAELNDFNNLTLSFDVNKLLVPTPPVYDPENEGEILAGKNPNVGPATAIVQSFSDAPGLFSVDENGMVTQEGGSVFKEELREINISAGMEYWYDEQFAFRCGYFHEHATKGDRKFITLGAGVKYQVFSIDMSYLISVTQQNPLANTLRFTLAFTLDDGPSNAN